MTRRAIKTGRLTLKTGRLTLAAASAALLAALAAHAQEGKRASEATAEKGAAAQKIDEFGMVTGCDHSARLDNFAIELENRPDAVALIIAYGPEGEGSGTGNFRLRVAKDYLVRVRGIKEERIKTVYGGRYSDRSESHVELWAVPPGAAEPKPFRYKSDAGSFKGKFAEYEGWDGDVIEYDPGTGPPSGNSTLAGFADVLKLQPKTVGYVVAYDGAEAAPGAWRRVAERDEENLRESYGVEAGRVKILFGGYRKETTVRLWVLPKEDPPPVAEGRKERRPEKAAQIGVFDQFYLKYEENERRAFRGFAEVLKADERLNACVIVRPDYARTEKFDPDAPRDPEEPRDVDLVQLAERWKARLSKEYGIGEHRFVVIVAPPDSEGPSDELETWVVPQGALLPDPSAVNDGGESKEENPKEL